MLGTLRDLTQKTALALLILLLIPSFAHAFSMNSGYYVGSGASRSITGVGFQPDLVIIKSDRTYHPVWTSSAMGSDSTAHFSSSTDNFSGGITALNSDGFSLGDNGNVNALNIRYTWAAFSGSGDGTFKVGSYDGNSTDDRNINGIGFQPDLVWIKRAGTYQAVWYSSSMEADSSQFFHNSANGSE